jgi:hypothetical protein
MDHSVTTMLRPIHMNNPIAAWRHFKESAVYYTFDEGMIDFRYEETSNGETNIIINYVETTDNAALHELLRTMIDDLLHNNNPDTSSTSQFTTIIFKGCATNFEALGLHHFQYKNKKFENAFGRFVMVDANE